MKYILIIGLLLSCSKPTLTASDELIITSDKCFVKYTIYRIVEHPTDSLRFQASGMFDCNYNREARHRIPVGKYLLMGVADGSNIELRFDKKLDRIIFSV